VPALCLAGRLPEQHNAVVNLDLTAAQPAPGGGAAADTTAWPEFHNGAAAGAPRPPAPAPPAAARARRRRPRARARGARPSGALCRTASIGLGLL
jgi:hypothetical protein